MSEAMSSQSPPPPLLELKDVWRGYNQGGLKLDVLTGASLTVRAGEMKALVGPHQRLHFSSAYCQAGTC